MASRLGSANTSSSAAESQLPLALQSICLRLLATSLLTLPPAGSGGVSTGSAACAAQQLAAALPVLPPELRQDMFLLLARWQLLGGPACAALRCGCFLPALPSLSLAGCGLLPASSLAGELFVAPLPRLTSLNLKGVLCLTDAILEQALQQCAALRQLDVSRCVLLTDAAVAAVAARLGGAPSGPPAVAAGAARNGWDGGAGPELAGSQVTAGAAAAAARRAQAAAAAAAGGAGAGGAAEGQGGGGGLQSLSLAGCWQVGTIAPLSACAGLTTLTLDGCWRLASSDVREVLLRLPRLESLSLSGCFQLDSSVLVTQWAAPSPAAAGPAGEAAVPPPAGGLQHAPGAGSRPGAGIDLCLPLEGVPVPRLQSLDLSGTAAGNGALLWVALRCCARLQRLAVAGCKGVDGLGMGAVLAAKRQLLQLGGPAQPTSAASPPSRGAAGRERPALEVLPLLELSAGGLARWVPSAAEAPEGLAGRWQEQQAAYERRCGPLSLLPSPNHPPVPWQLGAAQAAPDLGLHHQQHWQQQHGQQQHGQQRQQEQQQQLLEEERAPASWVSQADSKAAEDWAWPPESAAEVLLCLGPQGLAQLEALDLSQGGAAVGAAVAAAVGQHCRGMRRLNLSGCLVSDAELADIARLPRLTHLDVSGCTGSKAAAPGSRFQRHPAKRRHQGGVSDQSLSLLAERPVAPAAAAAAPPSPPSPPQQQPGQQAGGSSGGIPPPHLPPPEPFQALNASSLLVTDTSLRGLSGLTSLQLRGCKRLSDTGVLQCLLACPQLARLDLASCSQLSAAALGCSAHAARPAASGASPSGGSSQQAQQAQQGSGSAGAQHGAALPASVCSLAHTIPRRVALPRLAAAAPEALAWLAGHSHPPSSTTAGASRGSGGGLPAGGSYGSGAGPTGGLDRGLAAPLGCSPLQKLELTLGSSSAAPQRAAGDASSSGGSAGHRGGGSGHGGRAGTVPVTDGHLAAVAAACPQLKSLQLLSAGLLCGGLATTLATSCQLLSRLSVTDSTLLGDADLAALAQLPRLQHLNLSGCSGIGDPGLLHFAAAFSAAQAAPSSSLSDWEGPGAAGSAAAAEMDAGAARRPCLMLSLRLDGCSGATDAGIRAVLSAAVHLETLSLRRLPGLTDASALAALERCRNLRALLLAGSGVRGGFLDAIASVPSGGRSAAGGAAGSEASAGRAGSSTAVVATGLKTLELPQALWARAPGSAGLQELSSRCRQLAVKFG